MLPNLRYILICWDVVSMKKEFAEMFKEQQKIIIKGDESV